MPKNQFERMMFALITVVITVHAYVFYSLYVVNGSFFMQITGENSVLGAILAMGGIEMFGRRLPIYVIIVIEFVFAYLQNHFSRILCVKSTTEISEQKLEKFFLIFW